MNLTEKERELIDLAGQGLADKEIAREMDKGLPTVKKMIRRLLRRHKCNNKAALINLYAQEYPKDTLSK